MSSESPARPQPELALPDQMTIPAADPVGRPEVEDEVADVRLTVASQRQLIWWRFKKHKIALLSAGVLAFLYLIAIFAEPIAPYDPGEVSGRYKLVQPNGIAFTPAPVVYGLTGTRDLETLRLSYVPDESQVYPLRFFVEGSQYKLWGIFESNIHLFGVGPEAPEQTLFLLSSAGSPATTAAGSTT
jgi:peptide/nickel transport system permease protein